MSKKYLNSQRGYNLPLEKFKAFFNGDVYVDGFLVPRYGIFSIMARRIPIYLYDIPELVEECKTAFTDSLHIFIYTDFFATLLSEDQQTNSDGEQWQSLVILVIHELSHILYLHHQRLTSHPQEIRNVAMDIRINGDIAKAFSNLRVGPSLSGGYGFSEEEIELYQGKSEEEIAAMLVKPDSPPPQSAPENHLMDPDEVSQKLTKAGLKQVVDALDSGTKTSQDIIRSNINDAQQANSINQQTHGRLPGSHMLNEAYLLVRSLGRARLNWKLEISKFIMGQGLKYQYSDEEPGTLYYIEPEVMNMTSSVYTGSQIPAGSLECLFVIIDSSGSVSEAMLQSFLTEIYGLAERAKDYYKKIYITTADSILRGQLISVSQYSYRKELAQLVVTGRGGTNLQDCLVQTLESPITRRETMSKLIYFTDLLDTPPIRDHLPRRLPSIAYICPEETYDEQFANAVSDYAKVFKINSATEVNL